MNELRYIKLIISKMSATNKIQHTKKALLKALEETLGIVTSACKMVGVNRSTYYKYYNEDADFKEQVDSISDIALDFAESQLHKQIEEGNSTSTIFYLKTKGKKRGYIEKSEVDMNANHSGEIKIVREIKK